MAEGEKISEMPEMTGILGMVQDAYVPIVFGNRNYKIKVKYLTGYEESDGIVGIWTDGRPIYVKNINLDEVGTPEVSYSEEEAERLTGSQANYRYTKVTETTVMTYHYPDDEIPVDPSGMKILGSMYGVRNVNGKLYFTYGTKPPRYWDKKYPDQVETGSLGIGMVYNPNQKYYYIKK